MLNLLIIEVVNTFYHAAIELWLHCNGHLQTQEKRCDWASGNLSAMFLTMSVAMMTYLKYASIAKIVARKKIC